MRYRAVTVPMRQRRLALVCAEHASKDAVVEGDSISFASGAIVEDATLKEVDAYSGPRTPFGWPPDDYPFTITLEDREWAWLIRQIEFWGHATAASTTWERCGRCSTSLGTRRPGEGDRVAEQVLPH